MILTSIFRNRFGESEFCVRGKGSILSFRPYQWGRHPADLACSHLFPLVWCTAQLREQLFKAGPAVVRSLSRVYLSFRGTSSSAASNDHLPPI